MPSYCSGRADHCCTINGELCVFYADGCMLRTELGSWDAVHADPRYLESPAGRHFADVFPGYGCGDFPQNIPEVMNNPAMGKCCWEG